MGREPDELAQIAAQIARDAEDERSRTRDGFVASTPVSKPPPTRGSKRKAEEEARKADQAAQKKEKEVEKIRRNLEAQAAKQEKAKEKAAEKAAKAAQEEARAMSEAADTQRRLAKKAKEVAATMEAEKQRKLREEEANQRILDLEEAANKAKRDMERANRAAEAAKKEASKLRKASRENPQGTSEPGRPRDPRRPESVTREEYHQPWSFWPTDNDDMDQSTPAAYLEPPPGMGSEDIRTKKIADNIRKIHPELADYSDEFLAGQSVAELKKATRDVVNAEAAKPGKRLEMKHQQNFAKARANPTVVPEGLDNRSSILHEGRFLPGAAARGADLWLQARKIWGPQGVEAICNYDVTSMGLAGCITAKGLEALHNPGTEELSVKMFTVSNVINAKAGIRILSASEDRFETQETWKEILDMNELRNAYRNMRKAAFMIRPWDYSFEVLAAWLNPTTWLNDELKQFKRASLVGDFIDHILGLNAANWVQETSYLEIADIQTQWTSWWGVRKACAARDPKLTEGNEHKPGKGKGAHEGKSQRHESRGGRGGRGGRGSFGGGGSWRGGKQSTAGGPKGMPPFDKEATEGNICTFYNRVSGCRNDAQSCVQIRDGKRTRMFHKCNNVGKGANGANELCRKAHPQHEH